MAFLACNFNSLIGDLIANETFKYFSSSIDHIKRSLENTYNENYAVFRNSFKNAFIKRNASTNYTAPPPDFPFFLASFLFFLDLLSSILEIKIQNVSKLTDHCKLTDDNQQNFAEKLMRARNCECNSTLKLNIKLSVFHSLYSGSQDVENLHVLFIQ